jgi:VanZ family protein
MNALPKALIFRLPLVIVLILSTFLFFIEGPNSQSLRSCKEIWNFGHIIYFFLLSLAVHALFHKRDLKAIVQIGIVIGLTVGLGSVVEFLQYYFNRLPELGDLLRNMIGALVAIFFFLPARKMIPKIIRYAVRIMLIICLSYQIYPIVTSLIDEYQARRDFPILSDFQTRFQIKRWSGSAQFRIEKASGREGNSALQVNLTKGRYSGVGLKYFPMNWENHRWFQFSVLNPDEAPIKLTCRIHDIHHTKGKQDYHDRFNRTFTIAQGWNTIKINLNDIQQAPATRTLDLTQVCMVSLFASRLSQPRTIYIDDLRLL